MAKITKRPAGTPKTDLFVKTNKTPKPDLRPQAWWRAPNNQQMAAGIISTAHFLKEQNSYRWRQASVYAKLYSNLPLLGWAGSQSAKLRPSKQMPLDRPTMPVITSCIDTLVSRITQTKPRPIFLTDNGDYKNRSLSKQANQFTVGEFYRSKAYDLGGRALKDACILGTGCAKVLRTPDNRVSIERRLGGLNVLTDQNDSLEGKPYQMVELRLIERAVLQESFPKYASIISSAQQGFPDERADSGQTLADQIVVAEAWRLPSFEGAGDGYHGIAINEGLLFDEKWERDTFPFAFLNYSDPQMGLWGTGLAELLMGTQIEINKLLMTSSKSVNLLGVPRVFIEDSSKFVKSHFNNEIGMIGTYRGTAPIIVPGSTGLTADFYQNLERLVNYAYQMSGISSLSASAQKPAGLNSGEAIRNYDDLQSDRFAALTKRYEQFYVDLAYLVLGEASLIAKETGKYATIYPDKNGVREINLPKMDAVSDTFVIQCFDVSSLPRDPAGRLQKITEMMQAGIISPQEGRRLLEYPDIEQVDQLANAKEERILKVLDEIVEEGKYTPPDPFMDLSQALELVTQYYNLYVPAKLEPERVDQLIQFSDQVKDLISAGQPPAPPMSAAPAPGSLPMAVPQARPQSDVLPVGPGA